MSVASPVRPAERRRTARARSRLRQRLQAVTAGEREDVAIDLGDPELDGAALLAAVARPYGAGSAEIDRLVAAMHANRLYDTVLDQLSAQEASRQARSARLVGALRVEAAVPFVAALLSGSERALRDAAARALGRIGGVRSAAGLLHAVTHGAHGPTIVIQLAHASPDLFLEAALGEAETTGGATVAVVAAAGLRHRMASVRPLLATLQWGAPSARAASCRALGWLGAVSTAPDLAAALDDPSWRVRLSAAKALGRLHATGFARDLGRLLTDPHQSVRRAARSALRWAEA